VYYAVCYFFKHLSYYPFIPATINASVLTHWTIKVLGTVIMLWSFTVESVQLTAHTHRKE